MSAIKRILTLKLCCMLIFTMLSCRSSPLIEKTEDAIQVGGITEVDRHPNLMQPEVVEKHAYQPLKVLFLDVGQGDSILVINGSESMLIDGGPPDQGNTVLEHLKAESVSRLSYIIATHPHADHIGGLAEVIVSLQVDAIYMPKILHTTVTFEDFLDTVASKGMKITAPVSGQTFPLGDAEVSIIAPNYESHDNLNNSSIVLKIDHGKHSFLFTGDAESESEQAMFNAGIPLASDVLKVAHHGSSTSSSKEFIEAVSPSWAVISVGRDNTYGHPADSTIRNLTGNNTKIYRTDIDGTIAFYCNGYDINVKTFAWETTVRTPTSENKDASYIGNINSKIFHKTTCGTLPASKNQVQLQSRGEALKAGYRPCKKCNP